MSVEAMIAVDEPLFDGAQEALRFCYGYVSSQYEQSVMSKMAASRSRPGRGLSGLDGAAQSGIIRDIVSNGVSPLHLAILVARCAPPRTPCSCGAACCSHSRANFEWEGAISFLVTASVSEFSGQISKRPVREMVIKQHFGMSGGDARKQADTARKLGVDRETVRAYKTSVKRWLSGDNPAKVKTNPRKGEESKAWGIVDEVLHESGIVGHRK